MSSNTCLYCLRSDRSFNSEEHSIPRGLGNEDIKLAKGIVCDECNSTILSKLDTVLLDFDVISFLRSYHGLQSRKGNPITYKNVSFNMTHVAPDHILLTEKHRSKTISARDDGFKLNMRGSQKLTPQYLKLLARALYKIGLGLIYIDLGRDIAYSKRFDEVRKIILGEQDFSGTLAISKNPEVQTVATVQHFDNHIGDVTVSFFRFYYYGLEIFYEMEHRKIDSPPDTITERVSLLDF